MKMLRNKGLIPALALTVASVGMAQAATIPITFSFTGADFGAAGPPPTPANPTVGTNLIGTAIVVPFGTAAVTANGGAGITFTTYPPGIFAPSTVMDNSTFSFNGGANTFTGTETVLFGAPTQMGQVITSTITINGGTGIFSGATGSLTTTGTSNPPPGPGQAAPVTFSGRGQITAAGLTAVPEPATMLLFGLGLAGVVACRKTRLVRSLNS